MHSMDLNISLDEASDVPLFRQLAGKLKEFIESLYLRPGQLLPSTRELSDHLRVSRATVVRCYDELISQGYLESIDGIGTFVSKKVPTLSQHWIPSKPSTISISNYANQLLATDPLKLFAHDWPELNFGCAPASMLPLKQWRQLLLKHSRTIDTGKLDYNQEPFGYPKLREALADYLARARSARLSPQQLIVFPSTLYPLHLITQMLVDRGDLVAIGNPTFPYARHTLESAGARLEYLSVDRNGLLVDDLKEMRCPRMIYLNPSHHQPGGQVLSIERRHSLLGFAADHGSIIIEDDLDCHYRYSGPGAPCLQGLSDRQNTIYIGSFWQSLYPLVNVGFLVIPESLVDVFTHAWHLLYHTFHTQIPLVDQYALTDLLDGGSLERHIRKTGKTLSERMQALVYALTANLGKAISMDPEPSGMHVTVQFDERYSSVLLKECAVAADLPLVSTASHYAFQQAAGEFMVPFAHLDGGEIEARVSRFAKLLKGR